MSVEEAGLRAGAKYVWEASYKVGCDRGWSTGWEAGWDAALRDMGLDKVDIEEKGETTTGLQLNEEWAKLFAASAARRKSLAHDIHSGMHDEDGIDSEAGTGRQEVEVGVESVDLGGTKRRERTQQLAKLYGEQHGSTVDRLETRLDSRFQEEVTRSGAVQWPYV